MSYGIVNADQIGTSVQGYSLGAGNSSLLKNKIINGACVIDQRNAGASVTLSAAVSFPVDRFPSYLSNDGVMTAQQSSTAPTGFVNSIKYTTTTADTSLAAGQYTFFRQRIEGYNVADLNWGTANAKTVTLSFWVQSSLTGTFGGSLANGAEDRCYPFSYTISAANTWEQKTITIAGDTTGTWLTTNGVGLQVIWSLGCGSTYLGTAGSWTTSIKIGVTGETPVIGTNGATFYITGVQLEVGSSATGFEYVNYQTSLANCQRYYQTFGGDQNNQNFSIFQAYSSTAVNTGVIPFFAKMRTVPTFTYSALSDFIIQNSTGGGLTPTLLQIGAAENTTTCGSLRATVASGLTAGNAVGFFAANTNARLNFSAEL